MKNNDLTSDFFVNDYNKALEIDCNYLEALISKGQALVKAGQLEEALDIYNKALEIDCNCVDALIEKRQVLIKLECPEGLVEVYDKIIEMFPKEIFPEENEKVCFEKIKLLLLINASKDVEGDEEHEGDEEDSGLLSDVEKIEVDFSYGICTKGYEEYESGELSLLGFSKDYGDNE